MLADATGAMPSTLVKEADQRFLSEGLDRAPVIVHGRNSHENQPRSPQRRRLIATRAIESIAPVRDRPAEGAALESRRSFPGKGGGGPWHSAWEWNGL